MESKYWDLAAKQLEGKTTPAEQEELHRWLAANPAHHAQYQTQQRLWQLTAPASAIEVDTDAAWQKVRAGIHTEKQQQTKVIPLFRSIWRVAASVALLIGLAWLIQYYCFPYFGMEVAEAGKVQRLVVLPDSSRVWLNKRSKLIYAADFDETTRTVQLEGEAFFDVQRDTLRPFIIKTEEAQIKVLGTSFNIRAYPEEEQVELAVATGKVALTAEEGTAAAIVTPGYAANLNRKNNVIKKQKISGENAWAWQSGRLQFKDRPLKEVLMDLERYYGVRLQLQNASLGDCRFTGNFQKTELQEALAVLTATLQLAYKEINNQTYILTGPGC